MPLAQGLGYSGHSDVSVHDPQCRCASLMAKYEVFVVTRSSPYATRWLSDEQAAGHSNRPDEQRQREGNFPTRRLCQREE